MKKNYKMNIKAIILVSLLSVSHSLNASNDPLKCFESFSEDTKVARASDVSAKKSSQGQTNYSLIQQAIWQYKSLVFQVSLLKQSSSASSSSIAALNSEIASRKNELLKAGVPNRELVLTQKDREALATKNLRQTRDALIQDSNGKTQTQRIAEDMSLKEWKLDKTFEKKTGYSRDISQDGRFMATDDVIQDLRNGQEIRLEKIDGEDIRQVKFSPDSKYIVAKSASGLVYLCDAVSGKFIRKIRNFPSSEPTIIQYTPDSRFIVVALQDSVAEVQELVSGIRIGIVLIKERIQIAPDGQTIAVVDKNAVKIVNVVTREVIGELVGHTKNIEGLTFSRDGKTIATGSWDGSIRLWDVSTQKQKDIYIDVVKSWSLSLAFDLKANRLIVGMAEDSIREYNLTNHQEEILYADIEMGVIDLTISDDDATLHATERVRINGPVKQFVTRRWKLKPILWD